MGHRVGFFFVLLYFLLYVRYEKNCKFCLLKLTDSQLEAQIEFVTPDPDPIMSRGWLGIEDSNPRGQWIISEPPGGCGGN